MSRRRSARLAVAAVFVVAGIVLAGCGGSDDAGTSAAGASRLDVVANFYPMAEVASRVGGDRVKVTNLTPIGAEPHDVELTPDQVDELEDADFVVYLGTSFQPAVAEIASRRDKGTLDVLDGIKLDKGAAAAIQAERGDEENAVDPHFWLDPTLMATAVDEVTNALAKVSPGDAATFRANAERYKETLRTLDADFENGLHSCDRNEIVTSHAAFFYLARRYGLTQLPIAGLSPESEPSADRLAELTDEIKAKGITTVFYENLVSPKVSRALAREAGVKTAVLSPIEGLTKDELDAGKDYVAVMHDNLAALRGALGCR